MLLLLAQKNTLLFVALWKIFKSPTLLPEAVLCTVDGSDYMITFQKSPYDSYITLKHQTLRKLGRAEPMNVISSQGREY